MAIIEIAPPDPDAVKARLDVQAKSWTRPDALEHREPVDEAEIAYDALNCIHYLQGEITSLRAQLDDARAAAIEECARIADEYEGEGLDGKFMREGGDGVRTKLDIAKSIRALLSESKK